MDQVHGGWIGKCIGGAIGFMQENNKGILHYTPESAFPPEIPANDDLDLQVLWLQELLEKKGSRFSPADVAEVFAKYNLLMSNEYAIAVRNVELGIGPPLSGSFNNRLWIHSMGCPIRSEIWGFICPGNPDAAARYAYMDGIIDHVSESIYGEQFYAAIEAMSFVEKDLRTLIDTALARYVPESSKLSRCLRFVIGMYDDGKPWEDARMAMLRRFGSSDAADAVSNISLTVMALLYGGGDFGKTMMLAVNCGYDTDCTAATAGAIMGVIGGVSSIPEWWLEKVGKQFVIGTVDIKRYSYEILDLAKDTCAAGLSLARDGVIDVDFIKLPEGARPTLPLPEKPASVAFEVDYDGLPSIGFEEPKTVTLTVSNETAVARIGKLTFALPAHMEARIEAVEPQSAGATDADEVAASRAETNDGAEPKAGADEATAAEEAAGAGSPAAAANAADEGHAPGNAPGNAAADVSAGLALAPFQIAQVRVTFAVKQTAAALPQKNLIGVSFLEEDGLSHDHRFGLSGAARVKLIGPFWDDYDTMRFDADPYGEKSQKMNGIPDPKAMFNSFVNIDRAYIDETDAGLDAAEGVYVNLHEDRIDLREHVGYYGPCCFYLVHEFHMPFRKEESEMFIGNDDAYRIWLNGEMLMEGRESDMYMPYNNFRLDVTYKEGVNRVVVKLVRKGERFDFSYMMRTPSLGFRWYTDMEHVIRG
nr:ADP-ribosylglycohydrolase family protein [Paenibacillus sacheonensis]